MRDGHRRLQAYLEPLAYRRLRCSNAARMKQLLSILLVAVFVLGAGCAQHPPVTVRVLTYNIHHGEGLDGRIDLKRIARIIRQTEADLVALQEVDRGVTRSDRVDQPARLAELTGLQAVFEKNIDCQGGEYGNAVLSRLPIESHENHALPRVGANEQRGLLEVQVRTGGQRLVFFATHLDHQRDDAERMASVAALHELLGACADRPVIVAGDFNATPDSRVLSAAAEFLTSTIEGETAAGGTYPADQPERRIDHILSDGRSGLRLTECRVLLEPVASDHRPVLAVFELAAARP